MEGTNMERKEVACEIVEPSVALKDSYLSALQEYKSSGIPLDEGVSEFEGDFAGKDVDAFVSSFSDVVPYLMSLEK